MDPISWDALAKQEKIAALNQIDLDKDYFVIGHFDNRRREYQWTDYPVYLVSARNVLANPLLNKDRQFISAPTIVSTPSLVYVDLPGMILVTNELDPIQPGASGNYQIHFSCDFNLSDELSSANFMLNINGVDIGLSEITEGIAAGKYRTNLIWQVDPLLAGSVIKVRYKIIAGNLGSTLTVVNRSLMIDGVNSLTII